MDSAVTPIFRLRRNGRILGPYPRTRIRLMARRGEVFLTDELSLNDGPWVPMGQTPLAGEIPRKPGLVLKPGSPVRPPAPVPAPAPLPTPSHTPASRSGSTAILSVIPAKKTTIKPPPRPARAAVAVPQPQDPFADWAQSRPAHAPRHGRRRRQAGGGGMSLEVILLGLLGVLALVAIIAAAFWLGRGAGESTPRTAPAPAAAPAAPAASAEAQAFAGRTYALRETPGGAPAARLRLLADGGVEMPDAASLMPAKQVRRWTEVGGELLLLNAKDEVTYRFTLQAGQRDLTGTFYGTQWRQLTLEGR